MAYLRSVLKALLFVPLCALAYVLLVGCDALKLGQKRKNVLIHVLYAYCMRLIGLEVKLYGSLVPGPALIVANHCSYNDVLLIASLGDIHFTPKSDVKAWPLIGPLVARFNVLFVDRAPGKTREMKERIFSLLQRGGRICVFPEATTGDGRTLLTFKSALFSLAEDWPGDTPLSVQPLTVIYRRVNGKPIAEKHWPIVAWHGDVGFVKHLLMFFTLRRVEAEVIAHQPIVMEKGETRKQLCARAEALVASVYPQMGDAHEAG